MDKLITFAVPCYNSAAYMEHCVDTLLQGGEDIEIILVDDGSGYIDLGKDSIYDIDADGNLLDSVAEWDKHNKNFAEKCAYLNSLGLTELHYTASNGTDLTVGLIPEGIFLGGGENTLGGEYYNPNIPTEEIYVTNCGDLHIIVPNTPQFEDTKVYKDGVLVQ